MWNTLSEELGYEVHMQTSEYLCNVVTYVSALLGKKRNSFLYSHGHQEFVCIGPVLYPNNALILSKCQNKINSIKMISFWSFYYVNKYIYKHTISAAIASLRTWMFWRRCNAATRFYYIMLCFTNTNCIHSWLVTEFCNVNIYFALTVFFFVWWHRNIERHRKETEDRMWIKIKQKRIKDKTYWTNKLVWPCWLLVSSYKYVYLIV